jgi:hypothetical protein
MKSRYTVCVVTICVSVWACVAIDDVETSSEEQAGSNMQGSNMQGVSMQGSNMQGMNLQGFRIDGATLGGAALSNLRVERGEVIAEQGGVTLRGAGLVGTRLQGQVRSISASQPVTALLEYRIAGVASEDPKYDPTRTGSTFLYTLEQWVDESSSWQPACPADLDGRRAAIPIAATWNERGDRLASSTLFTFGCTTGVIAKCYRWGYRPWLTGYGADMAGMHQTCTRLARADYCGNGVSNTQDGTWVNVWDNLPAPGPIQRHGLLAPLGMLFEAGWGPDGAVCLSHARWLELGNLIANMCPDRLVPLGLGGIACDSVLDALAVDPTVRMFNESYLNLGL